MMNICDSDLIPFTELAWLIQPHVVTADGDDLPDEIIEQYLRSSAIEFIRKSEIVRQWVKIAAQGGVQDYPIEIDDCSYLPLSVKKLNVNGIEYHPGHEEDHEPGYERGMNTYWLRERNWIYIEPAPEESCDCELTINVYLTMFPKHDVAGLPEDIYSEWGRVIADGALAEILSVKSEPWYDVSQSMIRRRLFQAGIADAKGSALKGNVAGKHRAKQHRFDRRGFR